MSVQDRTLTYWLSSLVDAPGLEAQGAAALLAQAPHTDLVGALNLAAGTSGLELQGVLNVLAGTVGLGVDQAASLIQLDGEAPFSFDFSTDFDLEAA